MWARIRAFLGDVPLKLLAVVLFAILIPSLLVTALGLVTVIEADRYVQGQFRSDFVAKMSSLRERVNASITRRWEPLADTLASDPDRLLLLDGLRRSDPLVREAFTERGIGSAPRRWHVAPVPPPRELWAPGARETLDALGACEASGDHDATLSEASRLLRESEDDAVLVEARLAAARASFALGRKEESRWHLDSALEAYGDTIDATGVVRALPILLRLVELARGSTSGRVEAYGAAYRDALDRYGPHLPDFVHTFYSARSSSLGVIDARARDTVARTPGGIPLSEVVQLPERIPLPRSLLQWSSAELSIEGSVTDMLSLRLSETEVVHLILERARLLDDALLPAIELGLGAERLRLARASSESAVEESYSGDAFRSAPLAGPFAHLVLEYVPEAGSVPDPFRGFRVISLATYTWSVVVLVLAIVVGASFTFRHVMREVRTARLKTDFVSFISHELKTPLTAIRMYTETLLDKRVTDEAEVQTCLRLVDSESDRLAKLIDQILEYSKIQHKQKEFHFASCNIEDVVSEAVRLFHEHTQVDPRVVEIHSVQRVSKIKMDRAAMIELFLNLLNNAAKYSQPGTPIGINLRESIDDITVDIIDQGIGIRKRDQKRIFDRFYRAEDYLTRTAEGTGLGLTFAKYIAKFHNGDIKVSSHPNGGSVFTLVLQKTQVFAE